MNQKKIVLGAFWIEGTDKHFFGLRDAKNYQLLKGGNILDPYGKSLYPDPFPGCPICPKCDNRIIPTEENEGMDQKICNDCGSGVSSKKLKKSESKGFLGFFKRS